MSGGSLLTIGSDTRRRHPIAGTGAYANQVIATPPNGGRLAGGLYQVQSAAGAAFHVQSAANPEAGAIAVTAVTTASASTMRTRFDGAFSSVFPMMSIPFLVLREHLCTRDLASIDQS